MENVEKKARVLSAIQPTSVPTLGNYLGALKNWASMSKDNDCLYAVADLHAITVRQEPAKLRKQTLEMYALLLAIGLDPEESVVFVQLKLLFRDIEHSEYRGILVDRENFSAFKYFICKLAVFEDLGLEAEAVYNARSFDNALLKVVVSRLYEKRVSCFEIISSVFYYVFCLAFCIEDYFVKGMLVPFIAGLALFRSLVDIEKI